MLRKIFSFLGVTILTTNSALATFMPPNDLHLQDNLRNKSVNMTQAEFEALGNKVVNFYKPIVAVYGGTLRLIADWSNNQVNARAYKSLGIWYVHMYGGMARRPEVSPDGFTIVACHEVGHHLAGFPFYSTGGMSTEGQSDYFSTQACARNLWLAEVEQNATFRAIVDPVAKQHCDAVWGTENEQNLCYRIATASYGLGKLLGTVSFSTPDPKVVTVTYQRHPAAQCRLDTYFAGGLCDVDFNDQLIPRTTAQVAETSCLASAGYTKAARPRCWFKP